MSDSLVDRSVPIISTAMLVLFQKYEYQELSWHILVLSTNFNPWLMCKITQKTTINRLMIRSHFNACADHLNETNFYGQ